MDDTYMIDWAPAILGAEGQLYGCTVAYSALDTGTYAPASSPFTFDQDPATGKIEVAFTNADHKTDTAAEACVDINIEAVIGLPSDVAAYDANNIVFGSYPLTANAALTTESEKRKICLVNPCRPTNINPATAIAVIMPA